MHPCILRLPDLDHSSLGSAAAVVAQPSQVERPRGGAEATRARVHIAGPDDQATEDLVRSFLSLPIDTVVSVGKRIGGSPSLRRLIDLGERARVSSTSPRRSRTRASTHGPVSSQEYFERMSSHSP